MLSFINIRLASDGGWVSYTSQVAGNLDHIVQCIQKVLDPTYTHLTKCISKDRCLVYKQGKQSQQANNLNGVEIRPRPLASSRHLSMECCFRLRQMFKLRRFWLTIYRQLIHQCQ